MSYAGYDQHLCGNGHKFDSTYDFRVQFTDYFKPKCPYCDAFAVITVAVDQTNGYEDGLIQKREWDSLMISPDKYETCNLGHSHLISAAVYRIPSKEELDKLSTYINCADGSLCWAWNGQPYE